MSDVVVVDQLVCERVEDGDVGARPVLQVDVGERGEFDASGINNDEPGSGQHALLDAGPDDGVGLGGVGAGEQDAVGVVEVVERIGAARQTEGSGEPGGRGCVAQAGAVVDAVGADGGADELLGQVVLLVGGAGEGDHGDGVRAVPVSDVRQSLGDRGEGFVPGRFDQLPVASQQWCGQAVFGAGEGVSESALDAGVAAVDWSAVRRGDGGDGAVADVDVEGAADAAVAAGGRGRRGDGAKVEEAGFGQCAGGAAVDAAAAADAGGGDPRPAVAWRDDGVEAAAGEFECEGALDFGAHGHASPAGDAQVAIELDVGGPTVREAG